VKQGKGGAYLGGTVVALAIALALAVGWRHIGGDVTQGVLQPQSPHAIAHVVTRIDATRETISPRR